MSRTDRDLNRSKHPNRSAIPSNVARGMILEGTGKGGPHRDRREKRPNNARWKREAFEGQEGYTLFELLWVLGGIAVLGLIIAVIVVGIHFIGKAW